MEDEAVQFYVMLFYSIPIIAFVLTDWLFYVFTFKNDMFFFPETTIYDDLDITMFAIVFWPLTILLFATMAVIFCIFYPISKINKFIRTSIFKLRNKNEKNI